MHGIDGAEVTTVRVLRVENGWIVTDDTGHYRGEVARSTHVARTPDELAKLLHAWASRQADGK